MMLNIKFIREHEQELLKIIPLRGFDPAKADVKKLLQLDQEKTGIQMQIDELRTRRNEISSSMKKDHSNQELIAEGKKLKVKIAGLEDDLAKVRESWQQIMDWIPNLPLQDVPQGAGAAENQEIKAWIPDTGYVEQKELHGPDGSKIVMPEFAVNSDNKLRPVPHWEIGKKLDLLDLEAGAKVSGSRFYYLKNESFLIMWAIFEVLIKKIIADGFMPMVVPILVKQKAMYGSSHFPGDADQVYKIDSEFVEDRNQLFLVGSSEPPLFAYYMDNMLELAQLPVKMMALTPCFRSEAGSWGKDVRGMKRTHQFDKLEMDVIMQADLEQAIAMHEYLLGINEWLLQQLKLPYHVINMCTGDLGYAAAAKKYDVEVWLPSSGEFMETMSDSITTDFQARRLNIRYKDAEGKVQFAYTVNDTGATHRLLIAILDHYQQSDGSIKVPDVLQQIVGKSYIGKK